MTLLSLVLVSLLTSLGVWQLQRADAKARLIAHFEQNSAQPVLDLNATDFTDPRLINRLGEVSGQFRDTPVILLNNQLLGGRLGFHRFALFQLAGSDRHLLVNRGWVAASAEGKPLLGDPALRPRDQELRGMLVAAPRPGMRLGELRYRADAPLLELPYLDLAWLRQVLAVDLQPLVLLQDVRIIEQYRQQRQAAWLNPQRHRGYALMWFSLALALVVIYLVTNLKRTDPG
ncbi:SURF1 family protein [Sedimenticola hydrogenitrophicus]|uniref:SURF1 family protein n=1 Tax=Sedimenticola hydrogenitrophicus TaxID=2967975 RepID=UPI0023B0A081|nr:SURF1 family protein [Sedimenticola hydrogenitrophicus]